MKYKCVIIEDEPLSQDVLKKYIIECNELELIDTFSNAIEANTKLKAYHIDIMFLDINMPKLSGIDFLRSLTNPPLIIFTTSYSEYAVQGFELDIVDYLLKPFSFERFLKSVNKAIDILESSFENNNEESIMVKCDKKIYNIKYKDILYFESYGDYVKIIMETKSIVTLETLKAILNKISKTNFIRVHKSYIISINKIEYIDGNVIVFKDNKIPIGRRYKGDLFTRLSINN